MHGATGAEWEIWRILNPLGEQTGRLGALDRLRSGLGGRQGCVRREAPGADSSLRCQTDNTVTSKGDYGYLEPVLHKTGPYGSSERSPAPTGRATERSGRAPRPEVARLVPHLAPHALDLALRRWQR